MTTHGVPNLISIAKSNEELDLTRVYREHAATVSRWVRRLSGTSEASDTLQEIFEVAHRRLATFRGDAKITTWLYAITVRVVSARRRKARLRRLLFFQSAAEFEIAARPAETPADELNRAYATRVVYSVLEGLSERDRTLLILFELERLGTREISAILRITENNVTVSLHRARQRFRNRLRRLYPEEVGGANDGNQR